MTSASFPPSVETTFEYGYRTGKIHRNGKIINAFVIKGLPMEDGLGGCAPIAINYMLADNTDLSKDRWAVFVKVPPHPGVRAGWKLVGSGVDRQPLSASELWSGEIPKSVELQLESIYPI